MRLRCPEDCAHTHFTSVVHVEETRHYDAEGNLLDTETRTQADGFLECAECGAEAEHLPGDGE